MSFLSQGVLFELGVIFESEVIYESGVIFELGVSHPSQGCHYLAQTPLFRQKG